MQLGRCLKYVYAISVVLLLHSKASLCYGLHHANFTARCVDRERDALLAIKADLVDDYNRLSSWGSEAKMQDCCRWEGVYCDHLTRHVIQLHLNGGVSSPGGFVVYDDSDDNSDKPFGGVISPKIIELQHLEYLDLSYNNINASQIPSFIYFLSNLEHLDLNSNYFEGEMSELIGNLTNLRYLDLSGAGFSGANPTTMCSLSNLEHLDLSYSDLGGTKLPELIGNLTNLKFLDLSNADFDGQLPNQIRNLTQLRHLALSGSPFGAEIPNLIANLTQLQYLDLSSSALGGEIPYYGLGNLTHLKCLVLSSSNFTNAIEFFAWLPHLSSLEYLDLSHVDLSNVFDWPQTLLKLPNLRNLTLYSCQLPPPTISSTLTEFNTSRSLAFVDLGNNNITSSVFKWLCNYNSSLVFLDLSSNILSGSLPDVFGNMSSLSQLYLYSNQLEGRIPEFLAKLCTLQNLGISSNNLTGNISNFCESSCAQNSLKFLNLGDNNLSGPFPNIARFQALEALHVYSNKLSGTIPESIGNLSMLEDLDVSRNNLEGVISETHLSKLSKLTFLDLSSNFLTLDFHPDSEWVPPFQLGELRLNSCKMSLFPKWLHTQKNLDLLAISGSGISDIIPSWFWDLSRLDLSCNEIKGTLADLRFEFAYHQAVNLSWNQLEGPVPSFLSKASSLDLSNNKFSNLDSFLCATEVSYLTYLDLSSNHMSGELPDCWKQFGDLVFLDLSNNTFSGNIPSTMSSLSSTETLKVDNNMFEGELPSSLKNCTNLRVFDLKNNELSGPIPEWLGVGVSKLIILILRSNHFSGSMPSQLCHLTSIQVLDFSMNNITGDIPKCLSNLTTLAQQGSPELTISHVYESMNTTTFSAGALYDDEISIIWKGILSNYKSTLGLVKSIDFSSNKLIGEIPVEISHLLGLVSLNLSGNHLTGQISPEIGKLRSLQSLDLSGNQLSGSIPPSLLAIYGMGYLNLSYNNLFGKIPIGNQLQNYDASSFYGNPRLCGIPLEICQWEQANQPNVSIDQEDSDDDELLTQGFYISLGLGFAVGFWGVCGSLIFKRSWRYAYYNFLNASSDWLYVKTALIRRKLRDMLKRQS